jgi:hypothetical protein
MTDVTYDHAPAPVRDDLLAAHRRAWRRLAEPGTWLSGAERVAIMAETRAASACGLCRRRMEALSPYTVDGAHDRLGGLADGLVEAVHRVRTDPARLTRIWFKGVIAGGVTVEQYVEAIGVMAQTVAIDTFAHGLGAAPWPLPEPVAGEPAGVRPDGLSEGEAWVPLIAPRDATGAEADLFPKDRPVANIRRALSLVPAEVRGFFDLVEAQYLPGPAMRDFATEYRAISHAQIELVAGRVSSLNGCVY